MPTVYFELAYQGPRAPSEEPPADPTAPHLLECRGDAPSNGSASGPNRTPAAKRTLHHSAPSGGEHPPLARRPRYWAWADLMRRAFDVDLLACPRCGGRMRLMETPMSRVEGRPGLEPGTS